MNKLHHPILDSISWLDVLVIVIVTLLVGMAGYFWLAQFSAVDSVQNSLMVLSGMGPASNATSTAGKIFVGFYSLFCGLFFLSFFVFMIYKVYQGTT